MKGAEERTLQRIGSQTDEEIYFADVYVAKLPDGEGEKPLYPHARWAEVTACGNGKVRRQKYYAWQLLEYALRRSFGREMTELTFCKGKNGKWTADGCQFSLAHSHGVVAVAVSRYPLGVDVEKLAPEKAEFLQKTLTERERSEFAVLADGLAQVEYLFEAWTKKESIFKKAGDGAFRPSKISPAEHWTATRRITVDGVEYALSLAAENALNVRCFFDVALSGKGVE